MNQQIMIAETISGMKKAMRREDDASDSDKSIRHCTNRGNKLKRKAKYVQEGHLDLAVGPRVYRRKIDFNGYSRHIISRNPPRVDLDGDVFEEEDVINSSAELTEAEEDPYREIKLETVLRPLTSAAELKTHTSLSVPYRSQVLEEMVQNAQEMLHREYAALWRIKRMLTDFRGDEHWVPCGAFVTSNDLFMLRNADQDTSRPPSTITEPEQSLNDPASWQSGNIIHVNGVGDSLLEARVRAAANEISTKDFTTPQQDAYMATEANESNSSLIVGNTAVLEGGVVELPSSRATSGQTAPALNQDPVADNLSNGDQKDPDKLGDDGSIDLGKQQASTQVNGSGPYDNDNVDLKGSDAMDMDSAGQDHDEEAREDGDEDRTAHRMTTRARAQAVNSDQGSHDTTRDSSPANTTPAIHPFFTVPPSAIPSKENGLPSDMADETRRLLCAYAQKQEEVCRGAREIYHGLLRALRMRNAVMEWATAEGHVGEMSDGEDWYDKERWGLEDDLKKGEEVEEDDANTTGKKTRHRRAAAA